VHDIDAEAFGEAYGISPQGGSLVRPDGIVAWRSVGPFEHDAVDRALASVLARTG
jgi:hypothetical protein